MSDFGSCWCHDEYGLTVAADGPDRLCSRCRGRSPSACHRAHEKEAAA